MLRGSTWDCRLLERGIRNRESFQGVSSPPQTPRWEFWWLYWLHGACYARNRGPVRMLASRQWPHVIRGSKACKKQLNHVKLNFGNLLSLTLCLLGNFSCFFVVCWFFSKSTVSKNSFRNNSRMSNSLDSDQTRCFVGPDLGPNCLQMLSAGNTYRQRNNTKILNNLLDLAQFDLEVLVSVVKFPKQSN